MRIQSIVLRNIRCFSSLNLDLDRDMTLIFGTNGVGKTTVIDALAAAFSVMPGVGICRPFEERDLRIETTGAGGSFRRERVLDGALLVTLKFEDEPWSYGLELVRGKEASWSGAFKAFERAIQDRASDAAPDTEQPEDSTLPVIAIYSAHRSWQDRQHRDSLPVGRLAGYDGALAAGTDLAHLRAWWRDEDHRRVSDGDTPSLDAVEQAIARFLGEGAKLPTYSLDEQDIVVELPETRARLCLRELSDGYRGMVALVADIARRMSQLNPDMGGDLLEKTPGMVAIDELDLHLHPNWQRDVLPRLRATFPAVQMVITSHSPQVLASVAHNHEVVGLSVSGEVFDGIWAVAGRDSNAVLAEVMGDRVRPRPYEEKLDEFYVKIDDGDFAGAQTILEELEVLWGADEPTLVQARWALEAEEG